MEIIEAREEHFDDIVALWVELMELHNKINPFHELREDGPENWGKYLSGCMGSADDRVLVILDDEIPIGFCIGRIKENPPLFQTIRYGFISDMHIKASYRRKGIGEKLLNELLGWFKSRGIRRIELRVEPRNDIGMSFWVKQGFREHVRVLYREIQTD